MRIHKSISQDSGKTLACLRPATLLKKRLWHRCFPVNLAKFLRTPFLQNTSGRLLLQKSIAKNISFEVMKYTCFHSLVFHKSILYPIHSFSDSCIRFIFDTYPAVFLCQYRHIVGLVISLICKFFREVFNWIERNNNDSIQGNQDFKQQVSETKFKKGTKIKNKVFLTVINSMRFFSNGFFKMIEVNIFI